jgi:hypothetical protein
MAHLAAPETLELLGLPPFLHSDVTKGKDVKNKQTITSSKRNQRKV